MILTRSAATKQNALEGQNLSLRAMRAIIKVFAAHQYFKFAYLWIAATADRIILKQNEEQKRF